MLNSTLVKVTTASVFVDNEGWFGSEKYEEVAGFQSKLFEMSGFEYVVVQRKRDTESMKQYEKNSRLPSWYFRRVRTVFIVNDLL